MKYDNYDEDAIRRSRKRKSQLMKKKRQKILRRRLIMMAAVTFLIVLAVVIVNVTLGLKKTLGQKAAFASDITDETQSEILMPPEAPTEPPLIYAQMAEDYQDLSADAQIASPYAALLDVNNHRIIAGKLADTKIYPASMTKVMTLIVVSENIDKMPKTYTFGFEMLNRLYREEASVAGFLEGETVDVEDLMYGLVLPSGADAAEALAIMVAGSNEEFAKLMNEKANEIGCLGTYFITPNGLDAENDISFHHSTAGDLCVIMSYCAWKSPKSTQFLEITQTMQYTFETKKGQMVFSNHNRLLTETDYCISGKTGFTTKAGYCYVAAVEKDGRRMCLSLLGCGWPNNKNYKWADAKSLVEYAVSDAAEDSYCAAACVTTQQTGDTQTTDKQAAGKETPAVKKEDRKTINLKYIENNTQNKKICKNFLKNFTINIGNFF